MKRVTLFIELFVVMFVIQTPSFTQVQVWFQEISVTDLYVRGKPIVVGQIEIDVSFPGNVLVQFNGECVSEENDRILIAASNTNSWDVNDGMVELKAIDADINRNSFSHTRMYPVSAGIHTFYAVTHNFVETGGNGRITVHGGLTVKYFSSGNSENLVMHRKINKTYVNVRGNPKSLGQLNLNVNGSGCVMTRFDGFCIPDVGDKIVLAASDSIAWMPNDGKVTAEALSYNNCSRPFSHTRFYSVSDGMHVFYAVSENVEEKDGDGSPCVYASLTVEYFPDLVDQPIVNHHGIVVSDLNVRGNPVTVGQIDIDAPSSGKVLVHFDGECVSDLGDKIILAASHTNNWADGTGKVSVEAINDDINQNSFSHTRYYEVEAGTYQFYAVAENIDEQDGNGLITINGSLTVEFFPDQQSYIKSSNNVPANFKLKQNYPNPFNLRTMFEFELPNAGMTSLRLFNTNGQEMGLLFSKYLPVGKHTFDWDADGFASGTYIYQLVSNEQKIVKKMILLK